MQDTQFISLLKTFSSLEMNQFEKFLESPFFNSNKNITLMFGLIAPYYADFEDENIHRRKIFKKLFPDEDYDDGKVRYYTCELLRLAEDFLAEINMKKERFIYEINSLKELIERKQHKLAAKKLADAAIRLGKESYPNEIYFYYLHLLKSLTNYQALISDKRIKSKVVIEEGESIVMLFLVIISQTMFNLLLMKESYNEDLPNNLILGIKKTLDMEKLLKEADGHRYYELLRLYISLIDLKTKPDDDSCYYYLKSAIDKYSKLLNKVDLYNLLTALKSYCIQRNLRGDIKFQKERFEIELRSIELDAYSPSNNKYLQVIPFRNFILSAINANEQNTAEEFIKQFFHKLDPKTRDSSVNLAFASLYFSKKQYNNALDALSKVRQINVFFKHDVKSILLKIYFEMNQIEPALELIDSYKHFLKSNKDIPGVRQKAVLNYLKITEELLLFKTGKRKKTLGEISSEISSINLISNTTWLLEKINELKISRNITS